MVSRNLSQVPKRRQLHCRAVYVMRHGQIFKIGSSIAPGRRTEEVLVHGRAELVHVIWSKNAHAVEKAIRESHSHLVVPPDTPNLLHPSEWFLLTKKDVDYLISVHRCDSPGEWYHWQMNRLSRPRFVMYGA